MSPDQHIDQLLDSDLVPDELRELLRTMRDLIRTQRAALTIAEQAAEGWKARSELAEQLLKEALAERLAATPPVTPTFFSPN